MLARTVPGDTDSVDDESTHLKGNDLQDRSKLMLEPKFGIGITYTLI